jgi:2-(3-amino-3-carboxypropyl)histidine synthase
MIPYDIDFGSLSEKIKKMGFKRVLLQLPEGMQIYAQEIAEKLDEFDVFISANPCYGACDIETYPDMLTIQFGHSEIPNISYPPNILFVEAFATISFEEVVREFLRGVDCSRIGILASVQHIREMERVKKLIEEYGRLAFIGVGDSRIKYPGQVLGCNFSAARKIKEDVECFILLGTGLFHGLGVRIVADREVYVLDPYANRITKVEVDKFIKQRYLAISKAMDASRFGIIVSSKIGQRRIKLALHLKKIIEDSGRRAYLIMTDVVVPENLYYDVDVFVNTACPRITYDEYDRFKKPVISGGELLIALGVRRWEDLAFDEIVEVDK